MMHDRQVALSRFGLGGRVGDSNRIDDPALFLKAQLDTTEPLPRSLIDAGDLDHLYSATVSMRSDPMRFTQLYRGAHRQQAQAYLEWLAVAEQGFRERLVAFWTNHFAISADKPQAAAYALPQQLEAIRPHVDGNFADLLIAAVQHPSMLIYLDNVRSIGPGSRVGRQRNLGSNENLAREVLELHTLGVDGGYTQDDVKGLATAFTGWTTGGKRFRPDARGQFVFAAPAHEPGAVTVLGRRYRQRGVAQAEAVLRDLARHPATARHLARKLAVHFVSDTPPGELVDALASTFIDTDGDLRSVYEALIDHPAAWEQGLAKHRSPQDFVVAGVRALDGSARLGGDRLTRSLHALGQPLWQPGSPAGWPDLTSDWQTPAALMARIEWTQALTTRWPMSVDTVTLARELLGPLLSAHTEDALRQAGDTREALALLLLSPEFQQR